MFLGKIERSIEIKAQPEKIWAIVFWDRVPEWFDIIKKVEHTSEIKDGLGATAYVIAKAGGRLKFNSSTHTEHVPGRFQYYAPRIGGIKVRVE
jgi:hypothetical protein